MQNEEAFIKKIQSRIPQTHFLLHAPMCEQTTFKIGGPADYLIFPASLEEVTFVMQTLRMFDIPFLILGNGSNVLVLDKGIRGAVIKFGLPMASMRRVGNKIIAGAGALLKDVASFAACESLTGLEFACGIPGSVGGAVFMNAGAYDGEMKDVVTRVQAVTETGGIRTFLPAELAFGYRHSVFQDTTAAICEVEISLQPGDAAAIHEKIAGFTQRRESKQPLEMPSAGSTFKRPPGHFAGTLIEKTGLKGLAIGGAQVSPKHAGFVVNAGHATAQDVLTLIHEVQRRVYEKNGVRLYPEVRIIGE